MLLPLNFDYLYLGRYLYFAVVFIPFLLMVASQIICFILSYNLNRLLDEEKYKLSNTKNYHILGFIKVNKKKDSKEKFKKCVEVYKVISKIQATLCLFYWVVDIVLQSIGRVKDKNNVETENDLNALFSRADD